MIIASIALGVALVLSAPFTAFGMFHAYRVYRFGRRGQGFIDQSAKGINLIKVDWMVSSQSKKVAKALPFVAKDLGEQIFPETEDGKIT